MSLTARLTEKAPNPIVLLCRMHVRLDRLSASPLVAYLAAGDGEDYVALRQTLAPDVVTHVAGGATLIGSKAQEASWKSAHQGLSGLRHGVVDLISGSELDAVRIEVTGTHTGTFLGLPPTGRAICVDQTLFARIDNGLIAEVWEIVDTGSGLRQLGVLQDQPLSPGEV